MDGLLAVLAEIHIRWFQVTHFGLVLVQQLQLVEVLALFLLGLIIPYSRLVTFFLALLIISGLWFFLSRTETGRAIRATSLDKEVARLMGVNIREIYAITFGVGAAITGLAGASISSFEIISPEMGLQYTIIAFCVVVLGGMGYMPGALWGGMILGVAQSLAVTYLSAGISVAVTFFLLFVMLIVRPTGIVGKGLVA